MSCLICGDIASGKALANHVRRMHGMSSLEYAVQYVYDGVRPLCVECGCETRYSAFTFKRYCIKHAHIAEAAAGALGGVAPAWNKGLTARVDARIRRAADAMRGSGNPFFGKRHSEASLSKMRSSCRLSSDEFIARTTSRSSELVVETSYDDYVSRQGQYLDVVCVRCGCRMSRTLETFERGTACSTCFPTGSKGEREVAEYIRSLGFDVVQNARDVITPRELDVYVPSRKFAVEYNGLYVHMDGGHFGGVDSESHRAKTNACAQNDVRLMHIFEDEWRDKGELIRAMLRVRLGIVDRRIRASACTVVPLDVTSSRKFFDANHISGFTGAAIHVGLSFEGEVVAAMTFRVPRQRKYDGCLEIARFASAAGSRVYGAAGKLIREGIAYARQRSMHSLLTYADLRFGDGSVYKSIGFVEADDTAVDYWLTDGRRRYDRFKFKAKNGTSQRSREYAAGVHRIYGCGSRRYMMDIV